MKLYNILLLFCFAVILTSCNIMSEPSHPVNHDFVCVINADGTGFTKLLDVNDLPFPISKLWDMYVTQDGKLIFAADKYYITDPDSINPIPFTGEITGGYRGMTFSNDNKAYYCLNGDLYKYDFHANITQNLTENDNRAVIDPRISSDDSIIMFRTVTNSSLGIATYFKLSADSLFQIPELGNSIINIAYNSLQEKIYYEQANGLFKSNLDGSEITHVISYTRWSRNIYNLTYLNTHLVTLDSFANLKIIDLLTNIVEYSVPFGIPNETIPKCCKSDNKVFYSLEANLYYYNLDTQSSVKLPNAQNVKLAACPTWDGSKCYYIANVRINK